MRRLNLALKRIAPPWMRTLLGKLRRSVHQYPQRSFDRRFGVDTSGFVPLRDIDVDEGKKQHTHAYLATPRGALVRMLTSACIEYERFTFVDMGSGKGAVLLYASHFPFKRIVGVEYSERLNQVAQENIRRYKHPGVRCRDITAMHIDAIEYPIPEGPLLFYLFNPFRKEVMVQFLGNIERSLRRSPREVIIMILNPHPGVEQVLDTFEWLERSQTGWNHVAYRGRSVAVQSAVRVPRTK